MILGIETSCDEIAAARVDDNFLVHENIIFSSSDLAEKTGGVVPEIAARYAAEKMSKVLKKASNTIDWDTIDAIAVTNGPGLIGSLLTGIEAAKTLAFLKNKPLIPVFHIYGHMCANLLDRTPEEPITFPALVLTVSGGHNDIYLWKSPLEYERVGCTIDDAAGECFDKCARMLGLPYPGGPHLSKCAEKGDKDAFSFPRPMVQKKNHNFSFSGLKTALFYQLRDLGGIDAIDEQTKADLAASMQFAICDTLLKKFFRAAHEYDVSQVHLTGGVSANTLLQAQFQEKAKKGGFSARIPKKTIYSTDNAAMIAASGQMLWKHSKNTAFSFQSVTTLQKQKKASST